MGISDLSARKIVTQFFFVVKFQRIAGDGKLAEFFSFFGLFGVHLFNTLDRQKQRKTPVPQQTDEQKSSISLQELASL